MSFDTIDERFERGEITEEEYTEEWLAEGEDRALTPPDDDY